MDDKIVDYIRMAIPQLQSVIDELAERIDFQDVEIAELQEALREHGIPFGENKAP